MSEHTKGRITVTDTGSDYFFSVIRLGNKDIDVKCNHVARRLAAAWNVCEGMTTEAIEALSGIGSLGDLKASELNAARALLREALDTIEEFPYEDHEIADRIKVYLDDLGGNT
jgi:hypothetical protein